MGSGQLVNKKSDQGNVEVDDSNGEIENNGHGSNADYLVKPVKNFDKISMDLFDIFFSQHSNHKCKKNGALD